VDDSDRAELIKSLKSRGDVELFAILDNINVAFKGYDGVDYDSTVENVLRQWADQYNMIEEILIERGYL